MNFEERSLRANQSMEHRSQISASITRPQHRLEVARERMNAVCAERNYFSPVFQLAEYDFGEDFCPPHPS
jgi:hypothetical protein